ncbi:cytochrome P450 [Aaosphaeria arxii CBS 175.79]|uniref:Cytochrome P450 n=1 Tax=Aaosphaeria arxii CBS 175.79 TaxID=1450172 RepID=A0A6A5X6Y7_9PLEO|nr:cytochrome P450 [Aaosphaeria arxii CBS 175.79]KAF2008708.1 cytochrome P450 [Aaosphaeria arxii CBS 175.79]
MALITLTYAFVGIASAACLYMTLRAIYRLTLHPLVSFPGPRLRAVSHLPHAFSGWRGRQPYDVRDLHRDYGPVVRIAPDLLSFTSPSAWQDIYGHQAAKNLVKYGYFRVREDAQPMLTSFGADHVRQRTAFSHGFSDRAISEQEPALAQHIEQFLAQLRKSSRDRTIVDVGTMLRFLSFDIVGKYALSTDFGCLENNAYHPWVALLLLWFRTVTYVQNALAMGILAPFLMLFVPRRMLNSVKDHLRMSAEKVQQRLAVGDDPNIRDLWTYILQNKGEKGLTTGEMEVNAAVLLVAGTDPIADAIAGTLYFLAINPAAKKKLYDEIDGVITSQENQIVTMASTKRMPYIHACLNEGMRLYPPIPGGMRRQVAAGKTSTVAGYSLPEKTVVSVWQLPTFTLPHHFSSHDQFIPERWLPANHPDRPAYTLHDRQEAFQPFSVGPKNCLGKGLSYAEMKLILAQFLWHFEFELADNAFDIEKQKSYVFRDRPPLRVKLVERFL